jgi:hypothetical protein
MTLHFEQYYFRIICISSFQTLYDSTLIMIILISYFCFVGCFFFLLFHSITVYLISTTCGVIQIFYPPAYRTQIKKKKNNIIKRNLIHCPTMC